MTYYPDPDQAAADFRELTRCRADNAEMLSFLDRCMTFFASDPQHTEPPDGLGVEIGEALARIQGEAE